MAAKKTSRSKSSQTALKLVNQTDTNRRTHTRKPINLVINYQNLDQFFSDYIINISQGGIFIRSKNPLPVGTRLKVSFSLPGLNETIETTGEVAHVQDARTEDGFSGMGVHFKDLDKKAKARIDELVKNAP